MARPITRLLRAVGAPLAISVLLVGLPACSGGGSANGTKLTIPVLWAGTDSSGKPAGGIEKATVRVAEGGEAGFGLDLTSVEAKKAGPQWLAASTTAAAVATLISSSDPSAIDITYTVTGSIDGPSGGAILTVGTLAAIRGESLDPKVTMTGTIAPDGAVGAISGVPLKLRGAADAGYTTVLLPLENLVASGDAATTDMVELGRSLGLEVIGVKDVSEAYNRFTGSTITGDKIAADRISEPVALAAATTTQRLINRLRADLATPGASKGSDDAVIRSEADRAETALAAGDAATAYGVAQDAYTRLVRDRASTDTSEMLRRGMGSTRSALEATTARITQLLAIADARIIADSAVATLDPVAQLSMPFAMGWATYAEAVLLGIRPLVDTGQITADVLPGVAATIAEQGASIEVFDVDAIELVKAAPNPSASLTNGRDAATFLSRYTNFMIRSADANVEYHRTVLNRGTPMDFRSDGTPAYLWLATKAYQQVVAATPADQQSIDVEVAQSARAITYFVLGSTMVAERQSFGMNDSGIGSDPTSAARSSVVANAITIAGQNVTNQVDSLALVGIDASAAMWSARWGQAEARAQEDSPRALAGAITALNELWYDVIWVSSLRAAFES